MQSNTAIRDNFKQQFYSAETNIGTIEEVFQNKINIKPTLDKFKAGILAKKIDKRLTFEEQLKQAKNIKFLSDSEYTELVEYWNKYQEAISVDAFDQL